MDMYGWATQELLVRHGGTMGVSPTVVEIIVVIIIRGGVSTALKVGGGNFPRDSLFSLGFRPCYRKKILKEIPTGIL